MPELRDAHEHPDRDRRQTVKPELPLGGQDDARRFQKRISRYLPQGLGPERHQYAPVLTGPDSAPNFYEPGGISATNDTLYIADTNHHRIVAVDIATKKASVLTIELLQH